ncbi:hypothetical protein QFC22_000738 [Naganishia vaughanmartiniae]|uniref:Uncharacterized protein n=1 Tax=Naganishia vaughanmartiniae TaxID=1424756 RepID=A0ACC2XML6_9TREE|nr:hypothetical protein QFC22_000738 [Naganishia vaughanmartiniae]
MSAIINTIILASIAVLLYWVFSNQPNKQPSKKSPSKSLNKALEQKQDNLKQSTDVEQSPAQISHRPLRQPGDAENCHQQRPDAERSHRQSKNTERSSRRVRSYLGGEEPNEESQRSRRKWPAEETSSLLFEPSSFQQLEPHNITTSSIADNHRKKRTLDATTSDEDNELKASSRRTRQRDLKRKKHDDKENDQVKHDDAMDTTAVTLPGGYVDTDLDLEEHRPTQGHRRKRDETSDSEEPEHDDDDDKPKSERERHRLRGRAVRRRRANDSTENDEEMTLVQRSSRRSKRAKKSAGQVASSSEEATTQETDGTSATASSSGSEGMEVDSADELRERPPISLGIRATPFGETSTDDDETDEADAEGEYATSRASNSRRNTRATARQTRKRATQTLASVRKSKTLAVAASKKKHAKETPQSKRVSSRRRGEVWTEGNGQKYKISTKDGVRRQLVSVKEWQHKYKMPADSLHPDKDVMHLVLVEKWVTAAELDELERVKLLGWQSDDEESRKDNIDDLNSIGEAADAASPVYKKVILNKSLYNHESPLPLGSTSTTSLTASSLISLSASLSKSGTPTSLRTRQQLQQTILRPEAQLRNSTLRAHRSRPQLKPAMAESGYGSQ